MTSRTQPVDIQFRGGWSTDLGTNFSGSSGGVVSMPFLIDAENCFYELDGGPHKIRGAAKLNSTAITETAVAQTVMGLFEYVRQGTTGTASRKRIAHAGTKILKEDLDGTWDDLFTGLESGKIPSYSVFDDILVMASTSNTDVPKSWDQTTAQDLAGTPPNFSISVKHKNRLWASGNVAFPGRLYYSGSLDPEDWTGGTAGSIDIDPWDGDVITGLFTHKNELWVLKGPYKGSIHRITGSSPSDFARTTFIEGIGGVAHNAIFKFGDDVGFVGLEGQIHSLAATAAFGDFNQAYLSRPINTYMRDSINHSRLNQIWTVTDPARGYTLVSAPGSGQTNNDRILCMDFRFQPVRWSLWPVASAASVAIIQDSDGKRKPFYGGYDGFVLIGDQADRNWDGSAISYKVTTPFLNFGTSDFLKRLFRGRLGIASKGTASITFTYQRDNAATQSTSITPTGGGDVLGPAAANQFTLGTSTLAGAGFSTELFNAEGEFRDLQIQITQSGVDQDAEIHSLGVHLTGGPVSTEAN